MRLTTDQMIKIKNYFFSKGVCLVEHKSYDLHPELQIINTEVAKYFKSLVSRGISRKIFVWRHAYHFITPAGIETLREELCLDEDELPETHRDSVAPMEKVENVLHS